MMFIRGFFTPSVMIAVCLCVAGTSARFYGKPNSTSGSIQFILNEFPPSPPNPAAVCLANKTPSGF